MSNQIAIDLGYKSTWDLLKEKATQGDLMSLLYDYIEDDVQGWAHEWVLIIAKEEFDYTPKGE